MRNLKKYLKKIKLLFHVQIEKMKLLYYFWKDYIYYINTNYKTAKEQKDTLTTRIMLVMHQIEKGLSMKENPRIFGGEKACTLINLLNKYEREIGLDRIFILATNVLYEYSKDSWSDKSKEVRRKINEYLSMHKDILYDNYAGVKNVMLPPIFDKDVIKDFFESRNSVRDYSDKEISIQDLNAAIEFAKMTPSACNRQTSRVHFYNDPIIMEKLIENQLGSQGWCHRAKGIIVVTSNQSYFGGGYERYQSLIDGGLYAMNLVWGLHLERIATCFKMFVREPKRELEFKKIASIPNNEIPIVLIIIGYYKDKAILEPKSTRLSFI